VILYLDRETFGELELPDVGAYQYAQSAHDLMISYAIDEAEPRVWDCTAEEMHDELFYAMEEAEEVWAHHAAFDRTIHNGPKQLHLPRIDLERWRCSMALALSHALPGKLDSLCEVLDVPTELAKLKDGRKLLNLFTKPQPANRKIRIADRHTHPEEWKRFKLYAANDITAMRECMRRMPRWNWDASAVAEWHLDQRINDRGFATDRELCVAGANAAVVEKERIGVRFRELTRGVVDRPSQRDQFKAYLNDQFGLGLDNTRGETFQQLLKGTVEPRCRELMELSIASNKTSTAKYAALLPAIGADGRFRGGLQFAGASRTRRWAGRLFQPQNLPSRGLPAPAVVENYIDHLKAGVHDLFHSDLMLLGAASLRGLVVPEKGNKLVVADLSNIEGRVLAWLAGEKWKLDAFRAYDAGTGPDLYNITAVSIIGGDPWNVSKKDRNVFGKVPDLASGYQGGVAGYQTFAKAYGVRMADHWGTIQKMIDPMHVAKARENLDNWGYPQLASLEISETEWLASETCKLAWRGRHVATVKLWYALQDAAINAINEWGKVFTVGQFLKLRCVTHKGKRWLVVRLPSGRMLTYFEPHLLPGNKGRPSIAYWGEASEEGKTTRQWIRVFTHGGKMTGNCLGKSTRIVTSSGVKPITEVRKGDLVWDGATWVATDGVVSQGKKAVGTWLNLTITPDHLILDGNSWRPVMQQDECSTHDALSWAASSVLSPSFAVTPETTALQTALVPAGLLAPSRSGNCGEDRASDANSVLRLRKHSASSATQTSSLTQNCEERGRPGTKPWCEDVSTRQTPPSATTVHAASRCSTSGSETGGRSFNTPPRSLGGMNRASTWIAPTTTKDTNPATSVSSPGSSTPTTSGTIESSSSAGGSSRWPNSGDATVPSGAPNPQWPTTSTRGVRLNGSWQSTTKDEEVFDLLNCGSNSRFTVLTDFGPVVVHNCCQTVARDILVPSLAEAERRGYLPILSVHDEALTEVPDTDEFGADELVQILSTNPDWTPGLPLAAAGFQAYRYKKDD